MQHVASGPNQPHYSDHRTQKIVVTAIVLFALSGLMMGFAVGAFTRPSKKVIATPPIQPSVLAQKPTPTAATQAPGLDVAALGIGCPKVNPSAVFQLADGTTGYTLAAEIEDKSISKAPAPCGTGKDLHAPDLMCKIWLTTNQASLRSLSGEQLNPVSNLQNPFPKEEQNAFLFDGGQQQVQPCSQTGTTNWSYKLAPSLKSGTYFLAVVADWKGQVFNWSWSVITIKS